MLRMSVLALAAAAALGAAVLTPTIASADWDGWRNRERIEDRFERRDRAEDRLERRFDRFEDRFEHEGCVRVRQVWTPWGFAWRRIWICG
jgi:hypothetical protein